MRIATNSLPNSLIQQIQDQQAKQLDLQTQLSRNQRISRASEDPIAFRNIQEIQSQQRGMRSYRANMDRATFIADLNLSGLDNLKDIVRTALGTADLIETSIHDRVSMSTSANLLNGVLEQALIALNQKNDDQYLFSGSSITTEPFTAVRDGNGFVSLDAAVNQVAPTITEATKDRLVIGRAYEIAGTPSNTSKFTNSGAINNVVGTQFIYNGDAPAFAGAELIPLQVADSEYISDVAGISTSKLYKIAANAPLGEELPNISELQLTNAPAFPAGYTVPANMTVVVKTAGNYTSLGGSATQAVGDVFTTEKSAPLGNGLSLAENPLQKGKYYRIETIGVETDLTRVPPIPAPPKKGDIFVFDGKTNPVKWDGLQLKSLTLPTYNNTIDLVSAGTAVPTGTSYRIKTAGDFSVVGGPASGIAGQIFTTTSAGIFSSGSALKLTSGIYSALEVSAGTDVPAGASYLIKTAGDFSAVGGPASGIAGQFFTTTLAGKFSSGSAFQQTSGTAVAKNITYQIQTDGDFSLVGGPALGLAGQIFKTTVAGTFTSGSVLEIKPLPTHNSQTVLQEGESYLVDNYPTEEFVVLEAGDYGDVGGSSNMQAGDIFTWNGISLDDRPLGLALPNTRLQEYNTYTPEVYFAGQVLSSGVTYQALVAGDYTDIGGSGFMQAGDTFIANGAFPIPAGLQVADAPLPDSHTNVQLVVGREYIIVENPSTTDFSALGAPSNNVGTQFTYNGLQTSFEGEGMLVNITTGQTFFAGDTLIPGDYQIDENSSQSNFVQAGAASNTPGTRFVYNGIPPFWDKAVIQEIVKPTDFTQAGALTNDNGTVFTANKKEFQLGSSAIVYQLFPERATGSDFIRAGARSNDVGTVFVYNSTTAPDFGSDSANAGALLGYTREKLAVAYAGSDSDFKFQLAEGKIMSPFNDGKRNREFEALVNGLVKLRDAYYLASDAEDDDYLTRNIALERAKEAAASLGKSEDRVLTAIADMGVTKFAMSIAENTDDKRYSEREVQKALGLDIDQAEMVTKLTNSLDSYNASLQSSARSLQISLLDYI